MTCFHRCHQPNASNYPGTAALSILDPNVIYIDSQTKCNYTSNLLVKCHILRTYNYKIMSILRRNVSKGTGYDAPTQYLQDQWSACNSLQMNSEADWGRRLWERKDLPEFIFLLQLRQLKDIPTLTLEAEQCNFAFKWQFSWPLKSLFPFLLAPVFHYQNCGTR